MFTDEENEALEAARSAELNRIVSSKTNKKHEATAEDIARKKRELEAKAATAKAAKSGGQHELSNAELTAKIIAEEKARRAQSQGGQGQGQAQAQAQQDARKAEEERQRKAEEEKRRKAEEERRREDERRERERREREEREQRERREREERERREREERERREREAVKATAAGTRDDPRAVVAAASDSDRDAEAERIRLREEARMAKMLGNAPTVHPNASASVEQDPNIAIQRREEERMARLFGAKPATPAPASAPAPVEAPRVVEALREAADGGWEIVVPNLDGSPEKGALTLIQRGEQLNLVYPINDGPGKRRIADYRWNLPRVFNSNDIHASYENGSFRIHLSNKHDEPLAGATAGEVCQFNIEAQGNNEDADVIVNNTSDGFELSCEPSKFNEQVTVTLNSPPNEKPVLEFKFQHVLEEETADSIVRKRITVKQNIRIPFAVTLNSFSMVNNGARGMRIIIQRQKHSTQRAGEAGVEARIPIN